MKTTPLFCYGTLRRGFALHSQLMNSKFLGEARTKYPYALFARGIPFCVQEIPFRPVIGELYEVSDETLRQIDIIEGHPFSYCRKKAPLITRSEEEIEGWIYFYPEPVGELIVTGDFANPQSMAVDVRKEFPIRYEFSLDPKDPWEFKNEIVAMNDLEFVNLYWKSSYSGTQFSTPEKFMQGMSQGTGTEYHEGIRFDTAAHWVADLVERGFLTKNTQKTRHYPIKLLL